MGALDWLLGSGNTTKEEKIKTADPRTQAYAQWLQSQAQSLPGVGDVPIQGVAGLTQDQLNAFQGVRNLQGKFNTDYDTARDLVMQGSAGLDTAGVGDLYSRLSAPALASLRNQQAIQMKRATDAARVSGGGDASRVGVVQGVLGGQQNLAEGNIMNNIYAQAIAAKQREQEMKFAGASQLAAQAAARQGLGYQDAEKLYGAGAAQRGVTQEELNALFAQQQGRYQNPYQNYAAAVGLLPNLVSAYGGTETTTKTLPQQGLLTTLGGAAAAGLSSYLGSPTGSAAATNAAKSAWNSLTGKGSGTAAASGGRIGYASGGSVGKGSLGQIDPSYQAPGQAMARAPGFSSPFMAFIEAIKNSGGFGSKTASPGSPDFGNLDTGSPGTLPSSGGMTQTSPQPLPIPPSPTPFSGGINASNTACSSMPGMKRGGKVHYADGGEVVEDEEVIFPARRAFNSLFSRYDRPVSSLPMSYAPIDKPIDGSGSPEIADGSGPAEVTSKLPSIIRTGVSEPSRALPPPQPPPQRDPEISSPSTYERASPLLRASRDVDRVKNDNTFGNVVNSVMGALSASGERLPSGHLRYGNDISGALSMGAKGYGIGKDRQAAQVEMAQKERDTNLRAAIAERPYHEMTPAQKADLALRENAQKADIALRERDIALKEATPVPMGRNIWQQPIYGIRGKNGQMIDALTGKPINLSEMDDSEEALRPMATQIANYEMAPLSPFKAASAVGAKIAAMVKAINPTYDSKRYDEAKKTILSFSGDGQRAKTVTAFNTALDHMATLDDIAKDLNNPSNVVPLNRIYQAVTGSTGSVPPVAFDAVKSIVGAEISKAVVGGQFALQDREEVRQALDKANTPDQLKAVIGRMKELMVGQLRSQEKAYHAGTGMTNFAEKYLTTGSKNIYNKMVTPSEGSGKPKKDPKARFDELIKAGKTEDEAYRTLKSEGY